ncbi:ferritin heavy chain-like isoform X2 [Panonychus citri]|uniref:ferritin heavy chain-like isoform X2 n=1 Tax=Panonychus citri TaxID=50023 RepID=UPI00230791DB|nr:ferritin heavy chain-like isoform X2 [Panonychus citri]
MYNIFKLALFLIFVECVHNDEMLRPNLDRYLIADNCITYLQNQINKELQASLVYLNMGSYFGSNSVARKGFSKFFHESSKEENDHARKLIDYMSRRGAKVSTFDVQMPTKDTWPDGKTALEDALILETRINNEIHKVHYKAEHECKDPHLMDFLETEFMEEQIDSINQLKRLVAIISKMDSGMGEYLLDRQLLAGSVGKDEL